MSLARCTSRCGWSGRHPPLNPLNLEGPTLVPSGHVLRGAGFRPDHHQTAQHLQLSPLQCLYRLMGLLNSAEFQLSKTINFLRAGKTRNIPEFYRWIMSEETRQTAVACGHVKRLIHIKEFFKNFILANDDYKMNSLL